jgi:hypothetical protein
MISYVFRLWDLGSRAMNRPTSVLETVNEQSWS